MTKLSEIINFQIAEYVKNKLRDMQGYKNFEIWLYHKERGLILKKEGSYNVCLYFLKKECLDNILHDIDIENRAVYRVVGYNEDEKIVGITLDFKDL